jgi:hypothetical protein
MTVIVIARYSLIAQLSQSSHRKKKVIYIYASADRSGDILVLFTI